MTSLREQVIGLERVLEAEEGVYLRLRAVLRQEEAELITLDPAQIADTVERKRTLAEESRLLEDARRAHGVELSRALGFGSDPTRLSVLIEALGSEAGRLPELHGRLVALIGATRALLEANGAFAERSLRHVQETLRMLGRSVPEPVGYGPGAAVGNTLGRGRLVRASI